MTAPTQHTPSPERIAFAQHVATILIPIEQRRRRLVQLFLILAALFIGLQIYFGVAGWPETAIPLPAIPTHQWIIAGALWCIGLAALPRLKHRPSLQLAVIILILLCPLVGIVSYANDPLAAAISILATAVWALPIAIALIPFLYRGQNRGVGLLPEASSLKDSLFSAIVRHFGAWEYAPDAGMLQRQLHGSAIFPDYDALEAEDLFQSTVAGSQVFVGEVTAVKVINRIRYTAFHGLVMVVDISESRVKLRAPFSGHSVLLTDSNKTSALAERFANYQRVDLPNPGLEQTFELLSTAPAEAATLVSAPLLEKLLALHATLQSMTEQYQHADDKLGYWMRNVLNPSESYGLGLADFEKKFSPKFDPAKANPTSADAALYAQSLQMEWRADKCIVTLPYTHDLFEPNSLFSPPLVAEDTEVIWQTIQTATELCTLLDASTASSH